MTDDMWEGLEDGTPDEPSEDAYEAWGTSVTPEERERSPEEFWKARPVLEHIHTFARARMASPWATLGNVLVRVIAQISPSVQLPPSIGGYASLNLFIAAVGPSGAGKGASEAAGSVALNLGEILFRVAPLGSGEGIAREYVRPVKGKESEQWNDKALFTVGEIDTLAALKSRSGSTVLSQLRHAWMGETLGFSNANEETRRIVHAHRYRMCLVAGVQPTRAGVLLDDADGGTPQRFLWLPVTDPEAPDVQPPTPPQWEWTHPNLDDLRWTVESGEAHYEYPLPDVAVNLMRRTRLAGLRMEVDPLDSHALMTRAKVAAGLALLDSRACVNEEDWDLSGMLMAKSDATRSEVVRSLRQAKLVQNKVQALAEAEAEIVKTDHLDEEAKKRACDAVKRKLRATEGRMSLNDLRRAIRANHRPYLQDALEALELTGEVRRITGEYRGQEAVWYEAT